jgi:ferrous iron transport protein B
VKNIYIVGNPNSGKTSFFNAITGLNQKTGNYAGVTTEKKSAFIKNQFQIVDLPGCYSMYFKTLDERVVVNELVHNKIDLVIYVIDAINFQRATLMLTQILDLNIPTIAVVNMIDELEHQGQYLDLALFEKTLKIKTFFCNSRTKQGIDAVKSYITLNIPDKSLHLRNTPEFLAQMNDISPDFSYQDWITHILTTQKNAILDEMKRIDLISRFDETEYLYHLCIKKNKKGIIHREITRKIDAVAMHHFWGYIVMFLMLLGVFEVLFAVAQFPMDLLDTFFADLSVWVKERIEIQYLRNFIGNAIIPGISGVLIFIPQIVLLYMINTFLDESGYLSRMVYLMDFLLKKIGLSGKSILPLMSGNACAIPAISATRTIPTFKERLITLVTIPLMTCSAKLPVYTLVISLIFPLKYQSMILVGMYGVSLFLVVLFSAILNRFLKTDEQSSLIHDIPPYRLPTFRNIVISIKNAVVPFIKNAGSIIFITSILLWFLASHTFEHNQLESSEINQSFAAQIGHVIEPVIRPLGFDWKVGVGLLTSFIAREVFITTMVSLYSIDSDTNQEKIIDILKSPLPGESSPPIDFSTGMSILIFFVFSIQCISTLAAIRKETNSFKIPILLFIIMFFIAYVASFLVYQVLH